MYPENSKTPNHDITRFNSALGKINPKIVNPINEKIPTVNMFSKNVKSFFEKNTIPDNTKNIPEVIEIE